MHVHHLWTPLNCGGAEATPGNVWWWAYARPRDLPENLVLPGVAESVLHVLRGTKETTE